MRNKAFIAVAIDRERINMLLERLELYDQDKALKKALKTTAEHARQRLADQAQNAYTVKNAGFKKAMTIKATSDYSLIHSEGEPLPLRSFKTSKGKTVTKAQVVKPGRLKPLQRGGIKAFVNNIAEKGSVRKRDTKKGIKGSKIRHIAVAQREGSKRLGIEEKYSNSIPVMLGSPKRVYGKVRSEIASDLQTQIRMFVDRALKEIS